MADGARAVRRVARGLTRSILHWRAADISQATRQRSSLVLAPHPDDEIFGTAGTIKSKLVAGTEVTVAIVTDGTASRYPEGLDPEQMADLRRGEAKTAAAVLGLPEERLRFLGFADGALESAGEQLTSGLADLVAAVAPEEILVTSRLDGHPDHTALARAAHAVADGSRMTVLEYPVWFWARAPQLPPGAEDGPGPWSILFRQPVATVDVGHWRDLKRAAFAAYATRSHLDPVFIGGFFGRYEYFFPARP